MQETIQLKHADLSNLSIKVKYGGAYTFVIEVPLNKNQVEIELRDACNKPIADKTCEIINAGGKIVATATSDTNGIIRVSLTSEGSYSVRLTDFEPGALVQEQV